MEYKNLKEEMVRRQLRERGISDQRILEAFLHVERHRFIPPEQTMHAYEDRPLPIGEGQTISQPFIVALMLQLLDIQPSDRILEIGTGSGYQTALLANLCKEVFSIERIDKLYSKAQKNLDEPGYKNIHLKLDDGSCGWESEAPFERIIVSAAAGTFPDPLLEQLKTGGRAICPVGGLEGQELILAQKNRKGIEFCNEGGCRFVPLIGKHTGNSCK